MAEIIEKLGLSARWRRRGTVHASITKLADGVKDLKWEAMLSASEVLAARRLIQRLKELNDEFKRYHFVINDLVENEEQQEVEQALLDKHNDRVADSTISPPANSNLTKGAW